MCNIRNKKYLKFEVFLDFRHFILIYIMNRDLHDSS